MDVIEERDDPLVPLAQTCTALGVSRATLYRQTQPATPPARHEPAPSPRRLGDPERQAVLDVLHSDEFVDQPPPEVYATLLPRGVDLASIRTMYRLLAVSGESDERGAQRGPMTHAKPTLTATAPNQIWTWADVFYGRVEGIAARRQVALDAAYAAHPERFPNGPPIVRRPPASVAINPLSVDDAAGEAAAPPHTGTTSDAPEPGATPSAAARPQPLTSQSRNAPLNAIHS